LQILSAAKGKDGLGTELAGSMENTILKRLSALDSKFDQVLSMVSTASGAPLTRCSTLRAEAPEFVPTFGNQHELFGQLYECPARAAHEETRDNQAFYQMDEGNPQVVHEEPRGNQVFSQMNEDIPPASHETRDSQAFYQWIEAKDGLENYCFTLRNTLQEERLKDKFEGDDEDRIAKALQDTLDWLDQNQLGEKDEFEAKLEGVVDLVMKKKESERALLRRDLEKC